MKKTGVLLVLVCAVALLVRCANLAGTGHEGEARAITGKVLYGNNGAPATGAAVFIRPADYVKNPHDTAGARKPDAFVNDAGYFSLDTMTEGNYLIEVNDGKAYTVIIPCRYLGHDTILPVATLSVSGAIHGVIVSLQAKATPLYVQVFGLDRIAPRDSTTGAFSLSDVPAGMYRLQVTAASANDTPKVLDSVVVLSGAPSVLDTIVMSPFNAWLHEKKLRLNTTSSGAGVNGTVFNFPVLVRLNSAHFNFAGAQADGGDIRFTKSNGTPLAYEIDSWDATLQQAAVWVKVDTIPGNSSAQTITMYWGNAAATSASSGATVFDTAGASAGCKAVWHLGTECTDATVNKYNGENHGAVDTVGIIGNAKQFNYQDSIVIKGLMDSLQTLTLSAWVKVATPDTGVIGEDVISIGDAVLIRADETTWGTFGSLARGDTSFADVISNLYLANTGWRFVAFTINNASHTQSLYVDGALVKTTSFTGGIDYANKGSNTLIGAHGNGKSYLNFSGCIDEARVIGVARSADWLKLEFMNQQENNLLVEFK